MKHSDPPTYERSDAHAKPILITGVVLALLVIGGLGAAAIVRGMLDARQEAHRPEPSPLAERVLPPYPRLQPTEHIDLAAWSAAVTVYLESYAWVDQPLGRVRMPIEEAMARVAENGLPSWPASEEERAAARAREAGGSQPPEEEVE